jgi:Carboxypeptidase regulatory-like domain
MGRCRQLACFVLASAVLVPSAARAQASSAGVVRDASGAILPGATVEASSPVLIEKGRSVVTDGTGQYKIVDLRPGTYTVTFTLSGFNSFKREGIELTGSSTVTVNADLTVGSVAETVTVSGETPTVDIQSTQKAVVISEQVTSALPSGRSQYAYAVLVPGVTITSFNGGNQQDVGGTGNMNITPFTVHGSRALDSRLMINGLTARNLLSSGWASNFVPDMGTAAEVVVDISSGTADAYGAGFTMNIIPKEGGNATEGRSSQRASTAASRATTTRMN